MVIAPQLQRAFQPIPALRHLFLVSQTEKIMKTQPLIIFITAVNLSIPVYQFFQPRTVQAATADVPAVLRGRALEIIDERGRVRASLSVLPEDPKVMWKGKPYPRNCIAAPDHG